MTILEFYNKAVDISKLFGYDYSPTVCALGYEGSACYSVRQFDHKKSKSIESETQKSPEAALEAFHNNLNHFHKQYSQEQRDIEI